MAIELEILSDSSQARQDLARLQGSLGNIERAAEQQARTLQRAARTIQVAFAAATAVLSGGAVTRAADSLRRVNSQLALVSRNTQELANAREDVNRIAIATRGSEEALAGVYARLSRTARTAGRSQTEVAIATQSLAQAFQISGATASEAAGATRQIQQALASGVLRGEEFNSVMENAPRIAEAIAAELNVSVGELRALSQEGRITSEDVFNALVNQAGRLSDEFRNVAPTLDSAFAVFNTGLTNALANLDEAVGFSDALIRTFIRLGNVLNNTDELINLVVDDFLRGFALIGGSVDGVIQNLQNIASEAINFDFSNLEIGDLNIDISFLNTVRDSIRDTVNFAREQFMGLEFDIDFGNIDSVLDSVQNFANRVVGWFRYIYEEVIGSSYWTDTIEEIQELAGDLVSASNDVGDFARRVIGFFVDIASSITGLDVALNFVFNREYRTAVLTDPLGVIRTSLRDSRNLALSFRDALNTLFETGSFREAIDAFNQSREAFQAAIEATGQSVNLTIDTTDLIAQLIDDIQEALERAPFTISAAVGSVTGATVGFASENATNALSLIVTAVEGTYSLLQSFFGAFTFQELITTVAAISAISPGARGVVSGQATGAAAGGGIIADRLLFRNLEQARTRLQALATAAASVARIETQGIRDYNSALASQAEINSRAANNQAEINRLRARGAEIDRSNVRERQRTADQIRTLVAERRRLNGRINATDAAVRANIEALTSRGTAEQQAARAARTLRSATAQLTAVQNLQAAAATRAAARIQNFIEGTRNIGGGLGGAAGGGIGFVLAGEFADYLGGPEGLPLWQEIGIEMAGGFLGQVAGQAVGTATGTVAGNLATAAVGGVSAAAGVAAAGTAAVAASIVAIGSGIAFATVWPDDARETLYNAFSAILPDGWAATIADGITILPRLLNGLGQTLADIYRWFTGPSEAEQAAAAEGARVTARSLLSIRNDLVAAGANTSLLDSAIQNLTNSGMLASSRQATLLEDQLTSLQGSQELNSTTNSLLQEIIAQLREGGQLPGANTGGLIRGPGTGLSDSILARLSNGEFVINAASTRRYLPILEAINNGTFFLPGFRRGGYVGFQTGGNVSANEPIVTAGDRELADRLNAVIEATDVTAQEVAELNFETRALLTRQLNTLEANRIAVMNTTNNDGLRDSLLESQERILKDIRDDFEESRTASGAGEGREGATDILGFTREQAMDITNNLAEALAGPLSRGEFNNLGEVVRNSIVGSLQRQLAEQIETDLNTIFDTFTSAIFSSLNGSLSASNFGAGDSAFSTGIGQIFSSIGSFFGGIFHSGGIIPGNPNQDVPIIAQGGEAVLTREQQRNLFSDRNGGTGGTSVQNVTINISGNVDQRSIDQIQQVIASSPMQVGSAQQAYDNNTQGLRRR